MSDLTEFLLERLDEDAAAARAAHDGPWSTYSRVYWEDDLKGVRSADDGLVIAELVPADAEHIARWNPRRALAEIEAKRALIRQAFQRAAKVDGERGCSHDADAIAAGVCPAQRPEQQPELLILAAPYCAHPDFDPSWAAPGSSPSSLPGKDSDDDLR